MKEKVTVEDTDVVRRNVLVRVDYNLPFRPGTTEISDDFRIRDSLQTIRYLIAQQCRVVICSHLGRPNGKVVKDLSMAPISKRLSRLLDQTVLQMGDCIGVEVREAIGRLPYGGVLMLENLRFHQGEEANDSDFSKALVGEMTDIFVNDAFGVAHRAHSSTVGVTELVPSVAGMLMAREIDVLGNLLELPNRPFVALLGGAKLSDKISATQNLSDKVDTLLIGGGMVATFLNAIGLSVGDSPTENEFVAAAYEIMDNANDGGFRVQLPIDLVVAESFSSIANKKIVGVDQIPPGWHIMDVGPETTSVFCEVLASAKTVVWNGPMGVNEWRPFSEGTNHIAKYIAGLTTTTTVVGGGSTAEVVRSLGLDNDMSHVSTGGGACLQFLGGSDLPGVLALQDKI